MVQDLTEKLDLAAIRPDYPAHGQGHAVVDHPVGIGVASLLDLAGAQGPGRNQDELLGDIHDIALDPATIRPRVIGNDFLVQFRVHHRAQGQQLKPGARRPGQVRFRVARQGQGARRIRAPGRRRKGLRQGSGLGRLGGGRRIQVETPPQTGQRGLLPQQKLVHILTLGSRANDRRVRERRPRRVKKLEIERRLPGLAHADVLVFLPGLSGGLGGGQQLLQAVFVPRRRGPRWRRFPLFRQFPLLLQALLPMLDLLRNDSSGPGGVCR